MNFMPPKIGGKRQIDANGQRQIIFKPTGGKCTRSRGHCNPEKVWVKERMTGPILARYRTELAT